MAKRGKPSFSKKGLAGLQRVFKSDKGKGWMYRGEFFSSLRAVREKYPSR